MAEHYSFGVAHGPGRVDEYGALVGLLARDDLVQLGVGDGVAKFHEIVPLWAEETGRGWASGRRFLSPVRPCPASFA